MPASQLLRLVDDAGHDTEACADRITHWCTQEATPLSDVLEAAEALVHEDPVAAREAATAVRLVAERSGTQVDASPETTAASAALLEAQVLAIEGSLEAALIAVDRAREAFIAAGDPWRALRTSLGRMHILNEAGRTTDAIALARAVLDSIDRLVEQPGPAAAAPPFAPDWLRASCLTNLAVCHTFSGHYGDAADAYAAAERHLVALGRWDEIAILRQNQAEQLLEEGRASQARDMFARAARGFAEAGLILLEARCLADLGRAHVLLGETTEALATFTRSERLFASLDVAADLHQVRLHRAGAYLALNLYAEAALLYEQVVAGVSASGLAHYHAVALSGHGAALAALGRWEEAGAVLAESARRHERVGNVPLATAAKVELAAVLQRRGDVTAALKLLRTLRAGLIDETHRMAKIYVLLGLADAAGGREAIGALVEAGRIVQHLGLPPLRFRVDSRLGILRRREQRLPEARALLERAADEAEVQRALLPSQLTRISFLRDKARVFDELVALELAQEQSPAAAFGAAERAKARSLLELMPSPAATTGRTRDPELVVEQGSTAWLVAELSAVYDEMLDSSAGRHEDLRRRADELQAALSMTRLPTGSPGGPSAGGHLTHDDLRQQLGADVALLAYHVVDDDVIGFSSFGGELTARRVTSLPRIQPLLRRLEQHWRWFRAGPDFSQRHAARLTAVVEHDLDQLARELLDPLPLPVVSTGAVGQLAVVCPSDLHPVPFHALPVGGRPLVADWEVVTAPSGSVLARLPLWAYDVQRPSVAFATADPTIPYAAAEVTALAGFLPSLRTRIGPEATAAALRGDCGGAGVVHLACHGMFRPDHGVFSALRLADTWVTAADVATLPLTGALVALSACESGRQQGIGGEAVGLSWAALAAGAAAVLTSLWTVDEGSASTQMQQFYGRLADGAPPAAALRAAQLDSAGRNAHPYYWAPFTLTAAL